MKKKLDKKYQTLVKEDKYYQNFPQLSWFIFIGNKN